MIQVLIRCGYLHNSHKIVHLKCIRLGYCIEVSLYKCVLFNLCEYHQPSDLLQGFHGILFGFF